MTLERIAPDSPDYTEMLFHWHRYMLATDFLKGKKVIDMACGEGYGSHYLSRFAKKIVALDLDENAIINARNKYSSDNLSYEVGSVLDVPHPDASFDLVVSFETIEHLHEQDQKKYLSEIKRLLKPEGLLLVSTPDRHRTDRFTEKNAYHLKELYREEFIDLLGNYFSNINIYYQEINIASIIWPETPGGIAPAFKNHTVKSEKTGMVPTDENMSEHLYLLAVCSFNKDSSIVSVSSICNDVSRKPVEFLWEQNSLLRNLSDDLQVHKKRLESDVDRLVSEKLVLLEERNNFELDNAYLKEQLHIMHRQNSILAQTVNRDIPDLKNQLNLIYNSKSWKLVRGYWRLMDIPMIAWVLRPVRKLFLLITGRYRR